MGFSERLCLCHNAWREQGLRNRDSQSLAYLCRKRPSAAAVVVSFELRHAVESAVEGGRDGDRGLLWHFPE